MTDLIFKKYPSLKDKNFVKFLTSQLLSLSGGYIQNVALSALIVSKTADKTDLGLFLFASYLPVFLLSYPASKIQSKISTKALLIMTEVCLLIMSALLVVFADMSFGWLLCFGALWGTVRAFQTPAAASVPKIICDENVVSSAVAATNLALSVARAAGPIISGVIYTMFGFRASFIVNALSYIPSLFLISKTQIPHFCKHKNVKSKPKLNVFVLVVVFVVALCGTSYNIVFTGIGQKLNLTKIWFSVFMGCVGIGAVLGAAVFKRRKAFFAGFVLALLLVLQSFIENRYLICFLSVVWGFCDYLFFTYAISKINEQNDKNSIRSAMGIYTAVTTGALPLGYLGMSYISQNFGIGMALVIAGGLIGSVYLLFFGKIR